MITVIIECNNCRQRTEVKYAWIRDFSADGLREIYAARGFSDDYLGMDVCPKCREKFDDVTFRE